MKRLLAAAVLLLACPVAQADETEPKPVDETGFCYRFLEAETPSGESIRRREVVLVKPSSSRAADLQRLQDLEESSMGFRPGHTKMNIWHTAWFDGAMAYFGDGPDCSGLPQISPAKK
jgi:hypothetical protein